MISYRSRINKKIYVSVPFAMPDDRNNLVLYTNSGQVVSYGGVKVVKEFKDDCYGLQSFLLPLICNNNFLRVRFTLRFSSDHVNSKR